MKHFLNPHAHLASIKQLLKWSALIIPTAILAGSASALFLWSLEYVTQLRWQQGWLLWLLPLGGLVVGWLYHQFGHTAEKGNNLIMDEIHEPGGGVPARMAPLVLVGTLVTHLFGGSAGREGTAVQMGGALAGWFGRVFRIHPENLRVLLLSGVAAGFGSVFGTPLTGAIFAMEVLTIGRIQYHALIPVLIASVVGDLTCSAWGIKHAVYHIQFTSAHSASSLLPLDLGLLGKVVVVGALFGLASTLFAELVHTLQIPFKKYIKYPPLRPVVGGLLIISGVYLIGTRDYLGIGVSHPDAGVVTILSAFQPNGAESWSWLAKLLFTAVTLASGFKGGEVTPLFFIGATLGNALAWLFDAPVDLFAGLGFIAVFAGATNTPLACTVMGIELFGAQNTVYFATACFLAYFFSGHAGIYRSQRLAVPKQPAHETAPHTPWPDPAKLRSATPATTSPLSIRDGIALEEFVAVTTDQSSAPLDQAANELGRLRIFLSPTETIKATSFWTGLSPKRTYQEIVAAARRAGVRQALATASHSGFASAGLAQPPGTDVTPATLPLCVELMDRKGKLKEFCRAHGDLLQNKLLLYRPIEPWSCEPNHSQPAQGQPNE